LLTVLNTSGGSTNTSMYMNVPMAAGGYLQVPVGGTPGRPSYLQLPMGGTPGQPVYLQMQLGGGGAPAAPTSVFPSAPLAPTVPTVPGSAVLPGTPTQGYLAPPDRVTFEASFQDPGLPFVAVPSQDPGTVLAEKSLDKPAVEKSLARAGNAPTIRHSAKAGNSSSPFRLAVMRKGPADDADDNGPAQATPAKNNAAVQAQAPTENDTAPWQIAPQPVVLQVAPFVPVIPVVPVDPGGDVPWAAN
jgi:hypothetical protein